MYIEIHKNHGYCGETAGYGSIFLLNGSIFGNRHFSGTFRLVKRLFLKLL